MTEKAGGWLTKAIGTLNFHISIQDSKGGSTSTRNLFTMALKQRRMQLPGLAPACGAVSTKSNLTGTIWRTIHQICCEKGKMGLSFLS
jgi:hypothetical protein